MNEQKMVFPNNSIRYSIYSTSYFKNKSKDEIDEFVEIGSPNLEKQIIMYSDGKLISINSENMIGILNYNKLKLMCFLDYAPLIIRYAYNLRQVYSSSSNDLSVFCGKSYSFRCQDYFMTNFDKSEKTIEFNAKQRLSINHLKELDKMSNLNEVFYEKNLNKKLKLFEKIEKEKLEKCFPKETDWNLEKITDNTILELRLMN